VTLVRIAIDHDLCMGYGECVDEDPDAIVVEDGLAYAVGTGLVDPQRAKCLCESCPVGAISIAA
jgi:ferredoxin